MNCLEIGSSRGDFALRCSEPNNPINILFGNRIAAIINVKKSLIWGDESDLGRWQPNRPLSITSMLLESIPKENRLSIEVDRNSINGKEWNPSIPLGTLAFNEVHEWILPDTREHPFHIHLYHMQVVTPNGCGKHRDFCTAPGNHLLTHVCFLHHR